MKLFDMTHLTKSNWVVLIVTGLFIVWMGVTPSPYMPHAVCWRNDIPLVTCSFGFNLVIFVSYMVISAVLFSINITLNLRNFGFVFFCFGTFIFSCGLTHLMDVLVLWWSLYWLQVGIGGICAATSAMTAVYLMSNRRSIFLIVRYLRDHWPDIQNLLIEDARRK